MKKLLYLLAGLVLMLVVAMLGITRLVGTDELKQTLISRVKQQTGRELRIDGPVSWSFFPSLGVTLAQVSLRNPAGFPDDAALSIAQIRARVALLPLFSGRFEVEKLLLKQPQVHVYLSPQGSSNLVALFSGVAASGEASNAEPVQPLVATPTQSSGTSLSSQLQLAGIQIEDGQLLLQKADASRMELSHINLDTGAVRIGKPVSIDLASEFQSGDLKGKLSSQATLTYDETTQRLQSDDWALKLALATASADMQLTSHARLQAEFADGLETIRLDDWKWQGQLTGAEVPERFKEVAFAGQLLDSVKAQHLNLTIQHGNAGPLQLDGKMDVQLGDRPDVHFDLVSPKLDLGWFSNEKNAVPPSGKDSRTPSVNKGKNADTSSQAEPAQQEPDLRFLSAFSASGHWKIATLQGPHAELKDVVLDVDQKDGVLTIPDFSGRVYDGAIKLSARVDGRSYPAHLQLQPHVSGIQIQQLLKAWLNKEPLSGRANLDGQLASVGLLAPDIRNSLTGQLHLDVADGAVNGVNVAAMLRNAKAALKGQTATNEARKTDFSSLTADFRVQQGNMSSQNINMLSPLLRVRGAGSTHLVRENLDFLFNVAVVASGKGQGGQELEQLRNISIPLRVTGSWSKPDYALDLQSLLKQDLQQRLQDKLQNKLQLKLGKLFG